MPDIQVPPRFGGAFGPPGRKLGVVLSTPKGPVELRRQIVDRASVQPRHGIPVDHVIRVQPHDARRHPVFPDAERADAEFYGRTNGLYAVRHLRHEKIHVVASPVPDAPKSSRIVVEVLPVLRSNLVGRIRVEIVVEVHPVDVVAPRHVCNDGRNIVADFLYSRVQHGQVSKGQRPFGMLLRNVRGMVRIPRPAHGPIGIEPGVQLHAPFMRFLYGEGEGVVKWTGRAALRARKPSRTRVRRASRTWRPPRTAPERTRR